MIDDNPNIHADFKKILSGAANPHDLETDEAALFGDDPSGASAAEFEVNSAHQGQEGLMRVIQALADDRPFATAFVDIRMPPGWDGVETIEHLWDVDPKLQVVICTAHSDYSSQDIVRRLGETDRLMIIKKPFDHEEVRLAAISLCEKWSTALQAEAKNEDLERQVEMRTNEIAQTRDVTVFALARLAESRDPETGEHLIRMRAYSQLLAEELSQRGPYSELIDAQFLDDLYRSSPLHDVGKVGIPDAILLKPGALTDDEFRVMQTHAAIGADTLADAVHHADAGSFLTMAIEIARSHHERFNGTGYPDGLRADEIPLPARIVAVADVYDALTSRRVYKEPIDPEVAYGMIIDQRGAHFDPVVVDAFIECFDAFRHIASKHPDRIQSETTNSTTTERV